MKKTKFHNANTSKANQHGSKHSNPNKLAKAAALKYDGQNSPKLIAKGEGEIAKEIVSIAQDNEVHIHYDPLLLEVLSRLEMGEEIPETLYLAVAKIIAFAYFLQGKHPDKKPSTETPPNLTLSSHSRNQTQTQNKNNNPQDNQQNKTLYTGRD